MTDTAAREKLIEHIGHHENCAVWERGVNLACNCAAPTIADSILSAGFVYLGAPTEAPGHTDLMVTPESLDAYLEANPPPGAPTVVEAANRLVDGFDHDPDMAGSIADLVTAHAARERAELVGMIARDLEARVKALRAEVEGHADMCDRCRLVAIRINEIGNVLAAIRARP